VADNQQIVRIDYEKIIPLQKILEQQIIESLPALVRGVDVIAVSDYGKGLITHSLMAALTDLACKNKIQVIADPKGMDFTKYRGSHVIKPNLMEVYAAANLPSEAPLELAAEKVLEISEAETLMVTRSEAGISLFHRNGMRQDFSVRKREVKDVTGAGDTVLAVLACALANGLSMAEGSQLSNVAAGIVIEHFGCARVTLSELAQRLLSDDAGNKLFDEGHLNVLREVLVKREYVALTIPGEVGLTSALFRGIYQLSQQRNCDLLVYVPEGNKHQECVSLLASLHDVDYILTQEDHFKLLSSWVKPVEAYNLIDGKLVIY
ncbi:MAG TPA: PfkB family carbohydrate kinase, partial [Waddliaceae bacterium]